MWSTDIKLKYKEKRGQRVCILFFPFFSPDVFCIPSSLCKQKKKKKRNTARSSPKDSLTSESRSTLQFVHALCLRPDLRTKSMNVERYQSQKGKKKICKWDEIKKKTQKN